MLGAIQIWPFKEPSHEPSSCFGGSGKSSTRMSRTAGLPLRAMTTSSPALARAIGFDRLVLAAWIHDHGLAKLRPCAALSTQFDREAAASVFRIAAPGRVLAGETDAQANHQRVRQMRRRRRVYDVLQVGLQ